jgi:hypothetical protein
VNYTYLLYRAFQHPIRVAQQLLRIIRLCSKITPIWNKKFASVLLRAIHLCFRERFLPDEAFRRGLFNPTLSNSELSRHISRKKMTRLQESLNPVSLTPVLKDKSIFYRHCRALGISIPKLYAIFFKKNAGWSHQGSILISCDDWEEFLSLRLPSEFVIKPAQGAHGERVKIFRRTNRGDFNAFANIYKAADIYKMMLSDPKYDCFVIQERLMNHPELIRLSGTDSLQTVRFITFVDNSGQCQILCAYLKLILGQSPIDNCNWDGGRPGSLEAPICLNDGSLKSALTIALNSPGIISITHHPKTRMSIDQFQLPLWSEACTLVKQTALKFLPIRTIGWDVALTPGCPLLVEANIWWDPPNGHPCMETLLRKISL